MLKVENRESAHLRSRVKDLSVVPNVVSFTGLFECITPIAKLQPDEDNLYKPILCRDTDTLIANFGDPRVDPEKYVDLYSIMNVIGDGTSCYVAKVPSGKTGEYEFAFVPEKTFEQNGVKYLVDKAEYDNLANNALDPVANSKVSYEKLLNNKYVITSLIKKPKSDNGGNTGGETGEETDGETGGETSGETQTYNYAGSYSPNNVALLSAAASNMQSNELDSAVITLQPSYDSDNDVYSVTYRLHKNVEGNDNDTVHEFRLSDQPAEPGSDNTWYSSEFTVVTDADDQNASVDIEITAAMLNSVLQNGADSVTNNPVLFSGDGVMFTYDETNTSWTPASVTITLNAVQPNNTEGTDENAGNEGGVENPSTDQVGENDNNGPDGENDSTGNSGDTPEPQTGQIQPEAQGTEGAGNGGAVTEQQDDPTGDNLDETEDEIADTVIDKDHFEYSYEKSGSRYKLKVTLKLDHSDDALTDEEELFINKCEFDSEWLPDGDLEASKYPKAELTLSKQSQSADEDESEYVVYKSDAALKDEYVILEIIKREVDGNNNSTDTVIDYEYSYTYDNECHLVVKVKKPDTASDDLPDKLYVTSKSSSNLAILGHSSMTEALAFDCSLVQAKPYSLKAFYLTISVRIDGTTNVLGTAKVKLERTTTNQSIVNNLNSTLGTYVQFELSDPSTASAAEVKERGANSIAMAILDSLAPRKDEEADNYNKPRQDLKTKPVANLSKPVVLSTPSFEVSLQDYINTAEQFRDKKYTGCLMADMAAPINMRVGEDSDKPEAIVKQGNNNKVWQLTHEERRALHYYLKDIACERKDCTVILSVPYCKDEYNDPTPLTMDEACDWVASRADFSDLWEYGEGNTDDYSRQSFYLEMYYTWLNMKLTKIENGLAKAVTVKVPPSNVVIANILKSYRERGVQYPVAGDQYGTLSDQCTILKNPKTKLERDQLVQYRINPIWDTGTRGIQIYGNETLNAGYTDLNAAHIGRTLVYIRSRIDEYTETLKFLINSQILWDTWKNYVSQYILEPLKSENALSSYSVAMGTDTTSAAEIANRTIKGVISLTFYQSAEIFDLTFVVYSSATAFEQ